MTLSTLWLAAGAVFILHGQPLTAVLPLLIWFAHHRWEKLT